MTILAGVILLMMILFVVMGAVQLVFWLIVLTIIYLCVCSVWEKIVLWLKNHDS